MPTPDDGRGEAAVDTRTKAEQDLKHGVEQGVGQGLERGVQQGVQQGVDEGSEQGDEATSKATNRRVDPAAGSPSAGHPAAGRPSPAAGGPSPAAGGPSPAALETDDDRYWRRVGRAKRRARSDLADEAAWTRDGYHATYGALWAADDRVPRIDYDAVSEAEFIERFERPAVPVVIRGACATWPAVTRWTVENLWRHYGERRFKCGEDDDGQSVRIKMAYFLRYSAETQDDSPLYVFDGSFADRNGTATLLADYEPPKYFRDDLFRLAGERRRPPYRWIVVGPARSGTNIHIDPLGTSAWNTLVHGHKRWVLFPPDTPKAALRTPKGDGEAVAWFAKVYPHTRAPDWPYAPPIDLLQRPGETVFVPGGWWHVVMNLDMTVAVTQNFCSRTNFGLVWTRTRTSRKKFAAKLLERLQTEAPDLYQQAVALNADPASAAAVHGGGYGDSSSDSSSSSSSSSSDEGDADGVDTDCDCAECRADSGDAYADAVAAAVSPKRRRVGSP